MLLAVGAIIVGFVILVWGADRFVMGAAALARNLGVSPLLIGLTVVGFGTSVPEILVSVMATLQGTPELAVGNAIGSNIANIGLILGVTALVAPLTFKSDVLRYEYPVLLGVSLLVLVMLSNGQLSRTDSLILLGALALVLWFIVYIGKTRASRDPMDDEFSAEIRADLSTFASSTWTLAGLVLLLISSRMLVWGAVQIASAMGISDLVIGLTVVAIGTSLPELAAGVISALKREHDIAVGNVIGSNLFNLLAVLSVPGLFGTTPIAPQVITRDLPIMIGLTIALYLMGRTQEGQGHIGRVEGGILLLLFIGYQALLYYDTQPHL